MIQVNTYLNIELLFRAFGPHEGLICVRAFHLQKAVGCVPDATWEDFVMQHSIDDCTFAITCPVNQEESLSSNCSTCFVISLFYLIVMVMYIEFFGTLGNLIKNPLFCTEFKIKENKTLLYSFNIKINIKFFNIFFMELACRKKQLSCDPS